MQNGRTTLKIRFLYDQRHSSHCFDAESDIVGHLANILYIDDIHKNNIHRLICWIFGGKMPALCGCHMANEQIESF